MRLGAQTNFEPRGSAYQLFYLLSIIFYLFRVCLGILERPTLSGRAFRAGVRNRKRRMAIVKGCNLTPGCVFTVRGGGAASKENGVVWAGCCLRGNNPSRRGASYMRPSTGSHLRADTGAAPTEAREKITRYRTACGCSRAGASNPHRRCSRPRRRRHAGHPSRG